jgi:para-aminobenzoate synthetase/4-amino-4-deoxychorismate lyase
MRDARYPDLKILSSKDRQMSSYAHFETRKIDSENHYSYHFSHPQQSITFYWDDDLSSLFNALQEALTNGNWLAGYFCFELGYFFEPRLRKIIENKRNDRPLAWFGVFPPPDVIDEKMMLKKSKHLSHSFINTTSESFRIENLRLNISRAEYLRAIAKIKTYLKEGDTYQVNFTQKYKFSLAGNPLGLYRFLQEKQPVAYSALISDGQRYLLSLSPELFFQKNALNIKSKPMKGTLKRGRHTAEDKELATWLVNNPKNRAENTMIVDLIRNDLGKIAVPGKVQVADLYHTERFPTVHQMTSTVEATLKKRITIKDIIMAMFPCGSVTGVPKIRTMEIINELEKETRGIYTGAIGFISPAGEAQFNVAIRTLDIDYQGNGEMGIGGGIVAESSASEEYEECMLKATFLTENFIPFSLIETMRLEDKDIFLLDLHLHRLQDSADYFDMHYPRNEIESNLKTLRHKYPQGSFKIRLLLHQNGQFDIHAEPLLPPAETRLWSVKISEMRINSHDRWLFHKTTHRQLYDEERALALQQGFDEVIFLNERDEVCEGSISNIFLSKQGKLTTPVKNSGLLAGTLRESLITKNECQEKIIFLDHLYRADKLYLGNSVSGLIEGHLASPRNQTPVSG